MITSNPQIQLQIKSKKVFEIQGIFDPFLSELTQEDEIKFMQDYCAKHDFTLDLQGEIGLSRPCVGIVKDKSFPDIDEDEWRPERAYHKHSCIAVLEQDSESIHQLFQWLLYLEKEGYVHEETEYTLDPSEEFLIMFYGTRIVKEHKLVLN